MRSSGTFDGLASLGLHISKEQRGGSPMSAERDATCLAATSVSSGGGAATTREWLAACAGLSRDTIHKPEGGKRSPKLGTFLTLADTLGIDPCELLKGPTSVTDTPIYGYP
jgi:DNA-binding XRE family transcriptional regulator